MTQPAIPQLQDKTAIITGASSGIGKAAAKLFARAGARLVLGARRQALLDELVGEIVADGGIAVALAGDVREESYARALVETARARFGGLDIGFNNAGIMGEVGPTADLSQAAWREIIDTNLTGAFVGAKHQIPALLERGGGSIVFTSSFVGAGAGVPGIAAYSASKAGLIGLTQSLAAELGWQGVRVNALLPGGTQTPMGANFTSTPEGLAFVEGLHALKREARPEEIAETALFLASDAASFVTGAALYADGGAAINRA